MKQCILQQPLQAEQHQNNIIVLEQHHKNNEKTFIDPNYHSIMLNANQSINLSYEYSDNTGENISDKNLTYVDLTGVYWIWKNVNNYVYKGNSHYCRFFTTKDNKIMSSFEMLDILQEYDAIIATCARLEGRTVYQIFNDFHGHENMDICKEVIADICPEYSKDFDYVIINGEYSSLYNMMIAKCEIYNSYCEWLFSVLFELENRLRILGRLDFSENDYQRKVFGFIGERLLLVWLEHNKINYCEMPVQHFNSDLQKDS